MVQRNIDLVQVKRLTDAIVAEVGVSWFREHEHNFPWSDPHPLVQWRYETDNYFAANPYVGSVPPQSTALMAFLMADIEQLRRDAVAGLASRVQKLLAADAEEFLATRHELACAAEHRRVGRAVKFLPESKNDGRTPDLLVNGAEVECKRKADPTKADKARRTRYEQFMRKIEKLVERRADGLGVAIVIEVKEELSGPAMNEVASLAREILDAGHTENAIERELGGIRCKVVCVQPLTGVENIHIAFPEPSLDTDFNEAKWRIDPARGYMSCPTMLRVDKTSRSDGLTSLRRTLKNAAGQFSGTCPAVIEVDWPAVRHKLSSDQLDKVGGVLDSFLGKNSRVSAVTLLTREFVAAEPPAKLRIQTPTETVRSSCAKSPLPEDW